MADRDTNPGAAEAGGAAREQARELKAIARDKGEELKERALDEAESRKGRASRHVQSVAFALEEAAETLEERGESWLAGYARSGAEQVDRLTGYFEERDVREIARDVEDAARARPGMLIAGTFAAGFALSRFLRATAPEDGLPRGGGAELGYESRTAPGAPTSYDTSRGYAAGSGYATSRGYLRSAPRRRGGVRSERQRGGAAPPDRAPEPDVLADMETPGVRTGGAAMASHRAGSGRASEGERAAGERSGPES